MLDQNILDQVKRVFGSLENRYVLSVKYDSQREEAEEFISFLNDFAGTSDKLECRYESMNTGELSFSILKEGNDTGVSFRGIPGGHEFTSLLLAILNADGKGKNLPDKALRRRIESLRGNTGLRTFVSLSCTNCPDVVQALNVIALLNQSIRHETIDGALWPEEAKRLNVQAVPSVYAGDTLIHVGRGSLGELIEKLESTFGSNAAGDFADEPMSYDVVVLGGGPAGASAAIYSARKGLKVAVVGERIGGQVKDTVDIENVISVPHTTGAQLADSLRTHMNQYPIDIFENRKIDRADLLGQEKRITVSGGETFTTPTVIIATGAGWRRLNVKGESEYIGRGVAFCPHCDGPFYAGKDVAVIGGGNSGTEAAIDLAGICRHVTVIEFADKLAADEVLQQKVRNLGNVEIHTSSETTEVIGNGKKVTGIKVRNRITGEETETPLDGIFVQIGLTANSAPFREQLQTTQSGEIIVDTSCRTNIAGVYAAGDVTTVPYKQIVIAMGEGAKAALTAFKER